MWNLKHLIVCVPLFLISNVLACSSIQSNNSFVIKGTLSDFNGNRLSNGEVRLVDKNFKDVVVTKTDTEGAFQLKAARAQYNALYVCKDYKEKNLEFWYWNIPSDRDHVLDIKIHGLELYGVRAWRTFAGAKIFFRPMSLKKSRSIELVNQDRNRPAKWPINIAPKLDAKSLKITVAGREVPIWNLERVKDQAGPGEQYLDAYIAHIGVEKDTGPNRWLEVCLEAHDPETNEKGMACAPLYDL